MGAALVKIGFLAVLAVAAAVTLQNMCFTSIEAGKAAAVWDMDGSVEVIDGPKLAWTVRKRVQFLPRYTAQPKEYLVVRFLNGTVRHVPGPAAVRFHPLHHDSITTKQATTITGNEVLVVYRRKGGETGDGTVERHVVQGPGVHVPSADEWLHEFVWHGSSPRNKAKKIKKGRQFTKLRIVPTQMYYDVESIRSRDDQLLTIMLMIFFELRDIETMLDVTHDPIGDIVNAVSADVVKFAANRTYEELSGNADLLNDLTSYPQLTARAERIGYTINKVVYRGYTTTEQLQRMHNDAIETRTQLRLRQDTEREAQHIKDMVLDRETQRAELERTERKRAVMADLELRAAQHRERLREQREQAEAQVAVRRAAASQEAEHLSQLAAMGVDVTQVLVARSTRRLGTSALADLVKPRQRGTNSTGNATSEAEVSGHPDSHVRYRRDYDYDDDEMDDAYTAESEVERAARSVRRRRAARRRAREHHPDRHGSRSPHPAVHLHFDERDTDEQRQEGTGY